ncbi:MAG: hypothetical protein LBF51_02955, partial [Zoogloeaceae bacterium]|nr:hypothetical protein [Zoogloeaceae bacterium]
MTGTSSPVRNRPPLRAPRRRAFHLIALCLAFGLAALSPATAVAVTDIDTDTTANPSIIDAGSPILTYPEVTGGVVNLLPGGIANTVAGGAASNGRVYDNKVYVDGGSTVIDDINHSSKIYGGFVANNGDVEINAVFISSGSPNDDVIGAYTLKG